MEGPAAPTEINPASPWPGSASQEAMATLEALQAACVDCGRLTGGWCNERCYAGVRTPEDVKFRNQRTPYCTVCDKANPDKCHFCRKQLWCTPPSLRGKAFSDHQASHHKQHY